MLSSEVVAQEFIDLVQSYYPRAGLLLKSCYVKVVDFYVAILKKRLRYVVIYTSDDQLELVENRKDAFKDIAENMGLIEVVCLSPKRVLRDPMCRLKQEDPRLWLELSWISST